MIWTLLNVLDTHYSVKMGKLTSTIGIPIKLLNEAQVRYPPNSRRLSNRVQDAGYIEIGR